MAHVGEATHGDVEVLLPLHLDSVPVGIHALVQIGVVRDPPPGKRSEFPRVPSV